MTFQRINAMLLSKIGLAAESLGKEGVSTAVRTRMMCLGLRDPEQYLCRLSSQEELQALIEEVVVSESWFFREPASYELMRERALLVRPRGTTIRVLSLPCATGEEPYSVVMTLLEAGFSPTEIEVCGVDVSENALRAARQGRYSRNSFRTPLDRYRTYFAEVDGAYQLSDTVRSRVQFTRGNVLDPKLMLGAKFHAVFCRNLLIYLDKPSRLAALSNLRRLLRPEGVLFVGHAEAGDVAASKLQRTGDPRCFAFAVPSDLEGTASGTSGTSTRPSLLRPSAAGAKTFVRPAPTQLMRAARPPTVRPAARRRHSLRPGSLRPGSLRPAPHAVSGTDRGPRLLAEARSCADCGALDEAQRACERVLTQTPQNADAHCLLGVIRRAQGDLTSARKCFMTALHFDPGHFETLIHMALLAEHDGDEAAARAYRDRAAPAQRTT